ncbi:MAG: hypothetical protein OXR66_00530 [Candidatus Woesearchaeota archaeon]|nr:hypothetical protein [Candidatus Woesearchaeota archaeon]
MDNVKGILVLLVLVLGAATFLLFVRGSTMSAQLADAEFLATRTDALLDQQRVKCSATPQEFGKLADCIAPALRMSDFKQHSFTQPRKDDPGKLVIQNVNKRAYDADKFVFYYNREVLQRGCSIPGEIGHEVTCTATFPAQCEKGDVLEVFYPVDGEEVKVFLKTC